MVFGDETRGDQLQEVFDAEAGIEQANHLLGGESGARPGDSQLVDR